MVLNFFSSWVKKKKMPSDSDRASSGYSRTQWILFGILGVVNLLSGLVYSIQAPLYPAEAEKKGASSTEFGLVIGVYELTNFIVAPIFGSYMNQLGPFTTFHTGIVITGLMAILFGFLDLIDGHGLFITLSFLIRIPQAIGATAIITSSLTIVTVEFSNAISTTFAAMETFFGFGFCVGPIVGAALFEVGGFVLSFAVLGGLLAVSAPLSAIVLCSHTLRRNSHVDIHIGPRKSGLISLLKIPAIHFSIFAIISTSISLGFLSAVLEPHLRQFNLQPVVTGVMFLLFGGVYALTAPLWGAICDRIVQPKFVTLLGSIFIFIAYVLIGPAIFIPSEPKLWMTAIGLVTFGLGLGAIFVSSFIIALQDARMNGFPDNLETHALISGVWRSSVALGSFIGPSIAGALFDAFGFRIESLLILGLQLILIVVGIGFLMLNKNQGATSDELEPILNYIHDDDEPEKSSSTSYRRSSSSNS